jgi:hypothetical protein
VLKLGGLADAILPPDRKLPRLEIKGIDQNPVCHDMEILELFFRGRKGWNSHRVSFSIPQY